MSRRDADRAAAKRSRALIPDGKTRLVDVDAMQPHPMNRRSITTEMFLKLRKSIREDPELLKARPVLALPNGDIIGGRFRWEAVKAEGWSKVPTFAIDVDEDRALTIMLRDNNPYGDNDDEVVAEILWGLHERGHDLDLTGLPTGNVKTILASVGPVNDEGEDDLPPVPSRPRSKRGAVYQLGRHRIMVGDSTNADDVAKLLDGASVDLIVTSPPYNVDVQYAEHDDKSTDWDKYGAFLRATLDTWLPHLSAGRAIAWNIGVSPRTFHARQMVLLEELGLDLVRQYVWRKVGVPVPSWHRTEKALRARHVQTNYVHELVLVYSKGPLELGGEIDVVDATLEHDVFTVGQMVATRDVAEGENPSGAGDRIGLERRAKKAHPAVFPVKLPQAFIAHLTAPDEVVVDPFAGAGSTILAAEKLGRTCYAMEMSPAYVDVARDRWKAIHGG